MSFSSGVKDELIKLRLKKKDERISVLSGITNTAGSLTLGMGGKMGVRYVTEHHGVGRYVSQLATGLYSELSASMSVREHDSLNARNTVVKLSGDAVKKLLLETGALLETEEGIAFSEGVPKAILQTENQQKLFLRGAFLGSGSVSDPNRSYHLEIVCRFEEFALDVANLMQGFSLPAKVMPRKASFVVYLKESEAISDCLTLLGAAGNTLEFENARVVKNVRNYINRTSNCENANMQKTAEAAVQQAKSILYLKENRGLESLPQPLRDVAELRLNYPEASLNELASISGLGRSGINYRLRKLTELARELRIEKGELE